jgi:hypothetical protein
VALGRQVAEKRRIFQLARLAESRTKPGPQKLSEGAKQVLSGGRSTYTLVRRQGSRLTHDNLTIFATLRQHLPSCNCLR